VGKRIKQVVAGGASTYVVDTDGNGYSWGENSRYALNDGTEALNRPIPVPMDMSPWAPAKIALLTTGYRLILVVDTLNRAYYWGDGELPRPMNMQGITAPITAMTGHITFHNPVIVIVYAITTEAAYIWGNPRTPPSRIDDLTPGLCSKVKAISLSVVLCDNGTAFLGSNPFNMTGITGGLVSIATIEDNENYRAIGIDTTNSIFMWKNSVKFNQAPERVASEVSYLFVEVHAMLDSFMLKTSNGLLFRWEPVVDDTRKQTIPVLIDMTMLYDDEIFSMVSLGDSHVVALTSANRVFTWGSNENGQVSLSNRKLSGK
jgi:hypothetical protein